MGIILNLETATTNCSVSLAKDGQLLALKENNTPNYSHAEQLHVFIAECMEEAKVSLNRLDAVAVSKGPGSYTGLRIGVSAAKGLCFSLDIPLISIATLTSMAGQVTEPYDYIIPVLDARRMEVYSAVFDGGLNQIRDTRAEIIDERSFESYIQDKTVHILGSGAQKIKETLSGELISFDTTSVPSSKEMALLSHQKYLERDFEDVAYFEPYYLKDFMLQTKKK
ncbi:tRNA (adenosine(37)-N6)-threonylcarbamoyltransferase complex dimerization subunit type 1 TsaB [Maribacter chungangensis]|uniref:tRNA (Adenosine(37)-N6)-threonylcarbamoyltransferase complex dimerization subunit type 1 TsaB n=1 Tax=Maribacter chungangensis TaxID=1069117 RepID=A0ABW3B124_9FLAO